MGQTGVTRISRTLVIVDNTRGGVHGKRNAESEHGAETPEVQ
jgi:hypothetical protein